MERTISSCLTGSALEMCLAWRENEGLTLKEAGDLLCHLLSHQRQTLLLRNKHPKLEATSRTIISFIRSLQNIKALCLTDHSCTCYVTICSVQIRNLNCVYLFVYIRLHYSEAFYLISYY